MDDPSELAMAMFIMALCGLLLVAGEIYIVTKDASPVPIERHAPVPQTVSSAPSFFYRCTQEV